MRNFEELSMNAWPALQNIFEDGWIIRLAEGYTKRANSVNPLYYSSPNIDVKIDLCEQIFKKRNLKPVFKMTDEVFPRELDSILDNKGYKIVDATSLQTLDIEYGQEPIHTDIEVATEVSNKWINDYCRLNPVSKENKITLIKIIKNIAHETYFVSLLLNGKSIACGLGVLQNGYIGLFDIVVDINYRNQGYGEQLIKNIIKIGRGNGAEKAYLQVMLSNFPALKLYSKLGFKELYEYWYRVKD